MPPANEKTWRDQKLLHIVFGASAVVMLISTLWLLAKDHNREWKRWQLEDRQKDGWMLRAQHDKLQSQYDSQIASLASAIRQVETEPLDASLIEQFKQLVERENERLRENGVDVEAADFRDLDRRVADYQSAVENLEQIRAELPPDEDAEAEAPADPAQIRLLQAEEERALTARRKLISEMDEFISEAKRREDMLVGRRKFVAADRTAAVSEKGLMIGGGASEAELEAKQAEIDGYTETISELTADIAEARNFRTSLESVKAAMNAESAELEKEVASMRTELARLAEQAATTQPTGLTWVGEWITRWPVLNALYSGNVKLDQIWLPDLTINYNFSQAARFDRCKTCHRGIASTAPGTATEPAYPTLPTEEREFSVRLETPESAPESEATLEAVYGLSLTDQNLVGYGDEVRVHYVLPGTPAAKAGLQMGDLIEKANDVPTYYQADVANYLLNLVDWGEPAVLQVKRGLDHPFTSHPRLDLYLTDSSPHPEKVVGCTICHDGQGSGTEFRWTSHTPNDADEQNKWIERYGWFDNHHWIFPMKPERFAESNCTKCHFDKASLEPSERFPEPPAEKLVAGWTLVEEYGCFGCHEINGWDGPDKRIGPDLRLSPNYSEVALAVLKDENLTDQQKEWAEALAKMPDEQTARLELLASIQQDALGARAGNEAVLTDATHSLAEGLKDAEAPGEYRKVGPSLRHLDSKVTFDWLYRWIENPSDFRPSTRMPQFFGLWDHLEDEPEELAASQRFEPVEVRALAEFLLASSSEFELLSPPEEVTEQPSAERGEHLFQTRGCLACHSHKNFEGISADQGPDLSQIAAKLNTEKGALWLYSWLKQPNRYHARTKMPELYLDPIEEKDVANQLTGRITDPAADIAAYLLSVDADWDIEPVVDGWSEEETEALGELAKEWLTSDTIPSVRAEQFVQQGIPDSLEPKLKEDDKILLGMNESNRVEKLRNYVARRTISKYGCFGCHDISGFETAKPIGTALTDWGRKDPSKLAFENIHSFLEGPGNPKHDSDSGQHDAHEGAASHGHLNPADYESDTSYFIQSINSHSRDGFIWQKLRMPRSYDYKTTQNKGYNERLRMPRFSLTDKEREQIITFVLGLVDEAPADQFVYDPPPEKQAIVEGRQVLERFNCAGCHTLDMERWHVEFEEDQFFPPSRVTDFPFVEDHFSPQEVAESQASNDQGYLSTELTGMPVMNQETGAPQLYDYDGLPLEPDDDESEPFYLFTLYDDALVNGEHWPSGIQDILVPADREEYGPARGEAWPAWGGELARYLFPVVIEHAKQINPQVKGSEAWGWLPPPLTTEGRKVQTDWLHGFLMDPTPIRPAVVMRMPNFHMSSAEAEKLVNYFAAKAKVNFPYEYQRRQRSSYLAELESVHPDLMQQALNIVVDGNYCVKCHAVADYEPSGDPTTFGPNLAEVYHRLRPDYVREWVANPKRILPYTGMPVNIPYNPNAENLGGVAQSLFQGTSIEQLDGLVDLLMNFDTYARRQTSIAPMVESVPAATAGGEAGDDQASFR